MMVIADRGCIVVSIADSQVFLINLSIAFSAQPNNLYIRGYTNLQPGPKKPWLQGLLPGIPVLGRKTTSTVALSMISLLNLTSAGP